MDQIYDMWDGYKAQAFLQAAIASIKTDVLRQQRRITSGPVRIVIDSATNQDNGIEARILIKIGDESFYYSSVKRL